nr:hypothetical protein 4 [bacterium]
MSDFENYPYGKPSLIYLKAVKWLKENQRALLLKDYVFDYPDYWDMPIEISHKLDPDEVDWIQNVTYNWSENE